MRARGPLARHGHRRRGSAAGLLHRRPRPRAARRRCMQMLRRHPQIFMPESKEPWFFAAGAARCARRRDRKARRPRSRSTRRCSRRPAAEQRVGEATALYLWSQTAAAAHRRGRARRRASSRSCASPRASCARCTCSSWRPTSRPRPTCARRSRSSEQRRQGRDVPRHTYWPAGAALLRARSLRRAAAPLRAALRRRADAGADL